MSNPLEAKLKQIPTEPGVYFYRNNQKKIIYVGKAANLKHRVRSYWQSGRNLDAKTKVMLTEIADVQWQVTASEIDALFLESELIKRYLPKYNIELRDEKSYLYVKITTKAKYPTVGLVRRPLDDGAAYFGPYISGYALRKALRLLRKIFPYNTHTVLPQRVCLQYHLGLCPGLEEDKTPIQEYRANLKKLIMFLRGQRSRLVSQLEKEMQTAAGQQDFEAAAKLRDQFLNLKSLSRQIVFGDKERYDLSRDQALNGLMKMLGLSSTPRRIEAYDISHLQGMGNAASMTVFLDGVPAKGEYRRFKMQLGGNNDAGHIREVITRRFSPANIAKWPKPDLILIDGGKGQVHSALGVLNELNIKIPLIGLAKRLEEIILPQAVNTPNSAAKPDFVIIKLPKDSEALKLLQRIRDEAHRFAVSYHSWLRSQRQTQSWLEEIPGFGPATRKKLIKHFGSLAGVKAASHKELAAVLGPKRARAFEQYL